jgi:hypothetical protein
MIFYVMYRNFGSEGVYEITEEKEILQPTAS